MSVTVKKIIVSRNKEDSYKVVHNKEYEQCRCINYRYNIGNKDKNMSRTAKSSKHFFC